MARRSPVLSIEPLLTQVSAKVLKQHDYLVLGARLAQALALLFLAGLCAGLVQQGAPDGWLLALIGLFSAAYLGLGWGAARMGARLAKDLLADLQPQVVRAWLSGQATEAAGAADTLNPDKIGQGVLTTQQEVRQAIDHRLQFRPLALELRLLLPVLLVLVAFIHWPSAVALLLITPVMIMFMALVGLMLGAKAEAEQAALHRMAGSFADKMRCLPTIVALDWQEAMARDLGQQTRTYGSRAFSLIQLAFLNASILDFFASLSVAIVAVFLGLGHLGLATMPGFSGVGLVQSLPVLLLTVEFFQPFRRVSAAYHLKAKGEAALKLLHAHLETQPAQEKSWGALTLPYTGEKVAIDMPKTGLVVLTGPSGAGKSTLLNVLFGLIDPVRGHVPDLGSARALVDTATYVTPEDLSLRTHPLLTDVPSTLDDPACLSGGQRLRVGLVKALNGSARVLGLDEPTAKLDEVLADRVRQTLKAEAQSRLLIVATHDPHLIAMADQVLTLGHVQTPYSIEGGQPWDLAA